MKTTTKYLVGHFEAEELNLIFSSRADAEEFILSWAEEVVYENFLYDSVMWIDYLTSIHDWIEYHHRNHQENFPEFSTFEGYLFMVFSGNLWLEEVKEVIE